MRRRPLFIVTVIALGASLPAAPAGAVTPAAALRAGAGQADITPPQMGYYLGGWTRADRVARGQSTRLFANTLVLQRGARKVALVAAEVFAIPAGLQEDVARSVKDLGYDVDSVLLAASHTHSGPGGFANNPTYNTAAPSTETITDPASFVELLQPAPADRQLYRFLVEHIALSIRRADRDRAVAAAGWGSAKLTGLTENRSIEAHLADHGVRVPFGKGSAAMDPDGADHAIDPSVDVLRVDKLRRRKGRTVHVPIGAWSNFADHGTVVKSEVQAYSGDHHAAAWRLFAKLVRKAGKVPASQTVVNVYPNSDEGDQTAGLKHSGPSGAAFVGEREGSAMVRAWRDAGAALSSTPVLDLRWTRTCFCGRDTATGKVDTQGREGMPFLTGSEEGRGPLYDLTKRPFEGITNPVTDPVQGNKLVVPLGGPQPAVPLMVLRVGDGMVASIPGEATKEVGARVKAAVLDATSAAGVRRVVIAGLANEFIQYITTPEEYGQQSYEGASTLFGVNEATFLQERLVELSDALVKGAPAPEPYPLDTSFGVKPDGPAYPPGADEGRITQQPSASVQRLGHAALTWQGGASGHDRPVDAAFVVAERLVRGRWSQADSDLGLDFLWRVSDAGAYTATWEVPLRQPAGTYRLAVHANRYELASDPFEVKPLTAMKAEVTGDGRVRLAYPPAKVDVDLTTRPEAAAGGTVSFSRPSGRDVVIRSKTATAFGLPPGEAHGLVVAAGAAQDRYGNTNGNAVTLP